MIRLIGSVTLSAVLVAATLGGAGAASAAGKQEPGEPGSRSCFGNTLAYIAQGGNITGDLVLRGRELHDAVRAYCNPAVPT